MASSDRGRGRNWRRCTSNETITVTPRRWELLCFIEEAQFEEKALSSHRDSVLYADAERRRQRYERELAALDEIGIEPPDEEDDDELGCGMEDDDLATDQAAEADV